MSVTSSKKLNDLAYEIHTTTHTVRADVAEKLGGKDSAPSPHEYIEIALAACTAITLQMYADRKKIPLESVNVKINITEEGKSNTIFREIHLLGPLLDKEKASLLAIAEKCPIHKFLTAGARITTKLVEPLEA